MVFSRIEFLYLFLPAVLVLYFAVPNRSFRHIVLLFFSLLFYAWGRPEHLAVIIGLVLIDYFFGIAIEKSKKNVKKRKALLAIAVVCNLGCLCFYKYLGFFIGIVNSVFKTSIPNFAPEMPIGISFFTFQTMSYVIDVYRGDVKAQKSFVKLLLYVSFFPQLIAGPIVRYKDIDYQLDKPDVSFSNVMDGAFRFAIGLGKKVLIADQCSTVITSLAGLNQPTFLSGWGIAVFFTLQLYFDFSGYSDMAIGLGRIFGFKFLENFNYPLCASSATDFWRRWHISLGSFFRDYVYIPLGGNRHNQYRNILIVWFLTGLWHGASWNFIIWGLYYALLLTIEKKWLLEKLKTPAGRAIGHVLTTLTTVFGFAIFYYDKGLKENLGRLIGIGVSQFTDIFTNSILLGNIYLFIAAALLAYPIMPKLISFAGIHIKNKNTAYRTKRILQTVVVICLFALATAKLVGNTYSPFLYFRF